MDIIEIEISPITRSVLLGQALIWVKQVKLFEFAIIEVRLMDDFDKTWDVFTYKIEGQEYLNWQNDQYIIDWVRNKLSLEK
jgi:hypothetical protein